MSPPLSLDLSEKSPLIERAARQKPSPPSSSTTRAGGGSRSRVKPVLVIHGGAGTLDKSKYTPEKLEEYRVALRGALLAGHTILQTGGEAMDAAVAAVAFMEDCPLFNSGHGAVFNTAGKNEMESSLALSKPPASQPDLPTSRTTCATTLLTRTRNPIKLARALYLSPSTTQHVLHGGAGAEALAPGLGVELVDPKYFFTEARWREHRRGLGLPEEPLPDGVERGMEGVMDGAKGTVGAVALDERGCIAAATSTGGRTNKLPGRVGDTPLFGHGYWAGEWRIRSPFRRLCARLSGKSDTRAMGVSGTGDGDYFIRLNTGASLAAYMRLAGLSLSQAAKKVVGELKAVDGDGGVIALDDRGNVALELNCSGMYRGIIGADDGKPRVAIFREDELE